MFASIVNLNLVTGFGNPADNFQAFNFNKCVYVN